MSTIEKVSKAAGSASGGSNIETTWESFFRACDLPSKVSKLYARRFVKERMQPYMLKEITKEELKELGIEALGDQLSILRYVRGSEGRPKEFFSSGLNAGGTSNSRGGGGVELEDLMDTDQYAVGAVNFKSPDRDEIYHVRMPEGKTQRTRSIMERHSELRNQGLIKRGTTGVRVAGRDVRITGSQAGGGGIGETPVMIQDISSSSAPVRGTLGGMMADAISMKTTVVNQGSIRRREEGASIGAATQSTHPTNFIIRLDSAGAKQAVKYQQTPQTKMDLDEEMRDDGSLAEADIDAIVQHQGQLQKLQPRSKPLSSRFVIARKVPAVTVNVVARKVPGANLVARGGGGGGRKVVASVASKQRLSTNQLQRLLLEQQEQRFQKLALFGVEQIPQSRPRAAIVRGSAGSVAGRVVIPKRTAAIAVSSGGRVVKSVRAKPVVTRKSIVSRVHIGGVPLLPGNASSGGKKSLGKVTIAERISIPGAPQRGRPNFLAR